MGGNRQHRNPAAMTVIQPVDQVQIARAAASGADCELSRQVRLGAGREGCRFFMPHMDPVDRTLLP